MKWIDQPAPIRKGEELDRERLLRYLREEFSDEDGQLKIEQFPRGFSNLTYSIRFGERILVLRRPPFGAKIKSAHDMSREYTILSNLANVYPKVPKPLLYCDDVEVLGAPFSMTHDNPFRSESLTINLELGEEVEVKAVLQQGDALVYSWNVDSGDVYTDFHADPGEDAEGYPEGYFVRYRESETGNSSGSLVAPFDGNHGWYWLNIQENSIVITLEVRGYYESVGEIYRGMQ